MGSLARAGWRHPMHGMPAPNAFTRYGATRGQDCAGRVAAMQERAVMESHNGRSRSKKRSALFAFGIAVLLAVVLVAVTGTSSPAYCMGYRIFDDLQSAGLPLFEKDSQVSSPRSPEKDSSRSDLAETSPIQPDGLSEELVPTRAVRDAEEFLQYPAGLPAGCEPVSPTLALRCCGFDVTPEELIGGYLVIDETWTDSGAYIGSPYLSGGSFPPGMIATADAYLEAQASPLRAVDASASNSRTSSPLRRRDRPSWFGR